MFIRNESRRKYQKVSSFNVFVMFINLFLMEERIVITQKFSIYISLFFFINNDNNNNEGEVNVQFLFSYSKIFAINKKFA